MIDPNVQHRPLFGDTVGTTLVTTLFARAEGARRHGLIDWHDEQAERVWAALEEAARQEGQDARALVLDDVMNAVGTVVRSQAFDDRVADFLRAKPGAQVISLGVGLCNRASRLRGLDATWLGLDNAPVVELRRRLVEGDEVELVAGSVTDLAWFDRIDPSRPACVVAEGLLMYLPKPYVVQLLVRLHDHLAPGSRFVADLFSPPAHRAPHPIKKVAAVEYHFATFGAEGLAGLTPGWAPVAMDDTMTPINPAAARATGLFRRVTGHPMYGVATIERV